MRGWRSPLTAPCSTSFSQRATAFASSRPTFGPDVALARLGATAYRELEHAANPAANAIDGDAGAGNVGDLAGSPAWGSAYGDANPELTVRFPHSRIDRVLLATSSVGSTMPGIRSWKVEVRRPPAGGGRRGLPQPLLRPCRAHVPTGQHGGDPIVVEQVNLGGYAGGADRGSGRSPRRPQPDNPTTTHTAPR